MTEPLFSIHDIPYPLALVDAHMHYIAVNPAFCQEWGIVDDVIGKSHYDVFPLSPKRTKVPRHERALRGESIGPEEGSGILKGGRKIWFLTRYKPFFDDQGNVTSVLIASENIARRKETEEALNKAQKTLMIAHEEIEQYLWIIAHDLKSPMKNAAYLARDILRKIPESVQKSVGEPIHLFHENMTKALEKLDSALNFALFSQQQTQEEFSLTEVIQSLIQQYLNKDVREDMFRLHITQPFIRGYKFLYEVIFSNLISNAIKHAWHERFCMQIQGSIHQNKYIFVISDNGPGVPKKYHKNIWRPFQKTPETGSTSGVGMGLSLVERAVQKMDGRIKILPSQPGQGFTLQISTPIPEEMP